MTASTVPKRIRNLPLLVGLGVSALSLVIYLVTLSPTVNFIDSGELITVGATAGIAHPPGYPLYTLLTILAAALPFGAVAAQVNAVSALAGALASGLFYGLIYETLRYHLRPLRAAVEANGRKAGPVPGRRAAAPVRAPAGGGRATTTATVARGKATATPARPAVAPVAEATPAELEPGAVPARSYSLPTIATAAGAALLLSASYTFWDWSTQAKLYSLHYVFVAGLFWLALRVRRALRTRPTGGLGWPPATWPAAGRRMVALAALFGLGVTNHTMIWLLAPGLAVLLLWPVRPGAGVPWRLILGWLPWLIGAAILPLLIYLYLPFRAAQQPLLDWGSPDNWGDFWRHVTLWQSRVLVGRNTGDPLSYAGRAISMAFTQWGPWLGLPVFALGVAGIVRLARANRALLAATGLTAIITLVQTYNFQNAEVAAYNVPLYMLILLWAGVGMRWLITTGGAWIDAGATVDPEAGPRGPQAARVLAVLPLVLALLAGIWNIGRAGHHDDYLADAYVRNAFKSFAPNAVVITNNWYLVSASYYLQYVQHERPDVAIIDRKLIQYPFYTQYVDRQYAAVMEPVKDLETPFAALERQWVDGQNVDSQRISQLYFDMMHALISRNLAAGRPVYLQWDDPGAEEDYIAKDFNTHPEGMALRVDAQPFTGAPPDPQFDWRGILTDVVPKDDIAQVVIAGYPAALDRLASFAQRNNQPAAAAGFTTQAAQVRRALGLSSP